MSACGQARCLQRKRCSGAEVAVQVGVPAQRSIFQSTLFGIIPFPFEDNGLAYYIKGCLSWSKYTSYRGMVGEMVGGLVLERWGAVTLFSLAGMAALAGLLFFAILGRSVANVSSATLN